MDVNVFGEISSKVDVVTAILFGVVGVVKGSRLKADRMKYFKVGVVTSSVVPGIGPSFSNIVSAVFSGAEA